MRPSQPLFPDDLDGDGEAVLGEGGLVGLRLFRLARLQLLFLAGVSVIGALFLVPGGSAVGAAVLVTATTTAALRLVRSSQP